MQLKRVMTMTNYQYQGNTYRKKRRVKKKRINKVRFSLFILICLMLITGLGIGIKELLTDKVPFSLSISDDLNLEVGISEYQLSLTWDQLNPEDYENIQIVVDGEQYILDPDETSFNIELNKSSYAYQIEFKAKKKGFVFSNTMRTTVQTVADNEELSQTIDEFDLVDSVLTIKQTLKNEELKSVNLKTLVYDLVLPSGDVLETIEPTSVKKEKDNVIIEAAIPLNSIKDYHSLGLKLSFQKSNVTFTTTVKDQSKTNDSSTIAETDLIQAIFENEELVILNHQLEHYDYETHNFYAESLHVDIDSESDVIESYQLVDQNDEVLVDASYESAGNKAIDLSQLDEGRYFIYFNNIPIYSHKKLSDVWYTVTRNGVSNQITLETYQGMLSINVNKVNEQPENVYDILIDPGHGGLDTGTAFNNLLESEESLKISEYISNRLSDHGLKVKLTRTEDVDPAGKGNFDYRESPYYDEGRVEQVYRYQAKYMISNHLNSYDKSLEGFEVYTSVASTNEWAENVVQALTEAGQEARDSEKSEFRVSEGSYKKYFLCTESDYASNYGCDNEYMDYLYIIRETGGKISQSSALLKYNDNYTEIPNYGAETMLIEYAYIDNVKDSEEWKSGWENYGEAVVKATLEYLDIPYQSK